MRDVVKGTVCTSANMRADTQQHTAPKRERIIGGYSGGLDSRAAADGLEYEYHVGSRVAGGA